MVSKILRVMKKRFPRTELEKRLVGEPYYGFKLKEKRWTSGEIGGVRYSRLDFELFILRAVASKERNLKYYAMNVPYDDWWDFSAADVEREATEFEHNEEAVDIIVPKILDERFSGEVVDSNFSVVEPTIAFVRFNPFIYELLPEFSLGRYGIVVGKVVFRVDGYVLLER